MFPGVEGRVVDLDFRFLEGGVKARRWNRLLRGKVNKASVNLTRCYSQWNERDVR